MTFIIGDISYKIDHMVKCKRCDEVYLTPLPKSETYLMHAKIIKAQ